MDTALIYAAGFGTRMKALTNERPKPLLELGGKKLIDHILEMLMLGGISKFHINTHYLAGQIAAHFSGQYSANISLHFEAEAPYETGGTLKTLAPILPEAILTANSDVLFMGANPVPELRAAFHSEIDALLLLIPRENAWGYAGVGDFFYDGELNWRGEFAEAPFIYSGMQIIRPNIAQQIRKDRFSNVEIFDHLMETGRIDAVVYEGAWRDIGTIDALEAARLEMSGKGAR